MQQLKLDKFIYSRPKLAILAWGLLAAALGSAIASHYGSRQQSVDLCFYPVSAQLKDRKLKEQIETTAITSVFSKSSLSIGNKYCNPRRNQVGTIPKAYLTRAAGGSQNERTSDLATITQGLKNGWLYQVSDVVSDNPFKFWFGAGAIILGTSALCTLKLLQDELAQLRPHYRATQRAANIEAGYAIALYENDLKLAAESILVKLRGVREAESRQAFLGSITFEQSQVMLQSMSVEDYHDFGYLLDGGASFQKFLTPDETPEFNPVKFKPTTELTEPTEFSPRTPESETTDLNLEFVEAIDNLSERTERTERNFTKTSDLTRTRIDKYEVYVQQGIKIIRQAGSPGKCKAIVAPSRTGKTTVLYFMLEESYKLIGADNLTCYVWQGKGVEPIHPNIPKVNHNGFTLQNYGLEALESVWAEYEHRQELLEQGYRNFAPVLLLITDWQSIKDQLVAYDPTLFKQIAAKIMTLANNGAVLGTTIWLDTQSPNISDWGLGSSSIRDNFDIFAIARLGTDRNGQPIGDTRCIIKILNNQYLVANESDRTLCLEQFKLLIQGMESGKINTSVMLSTAGVIRLGITPEFERSSLQFAT
jgi:hypothetical protein